MRVKLTHNDGIKTLGDIARYLELEEECLMAAKPPSVLIVKTGSHKAFKHKRKRLEVLPRMVMINLGITRKPNTREENELAKRTKVR